MGVVACWHSLSTLEMRRHVLSAPAAIVIVLMGVSALSACDPPVRRSVVLSWRNFAEDLRAAGLKEFGEFKSEFGWQKAIDEQLVMEFSASKSDKTPPHVSRIQSEMLSLAGVGGGRLSLRVNGIPQSEEKCLKDIEALCQVVGCSDKPFRDWHESAAKGFEGAGLVETSMDKRIAISIRPSYNAENPWRVMVAIGFPYDDGKEE